MTPLHCAAFSGHLSVVEYLIDHKADENSNGEIIWIMFMI